ncbi:MAG: phage major capsid protein [Azoarcus sp.]|nr:phage major capsid protein [Azoarcus sp.]
MDCKQRELADEVLQLKQRGALPVGELLTTSGSPSERIARAIGSEAEILKKNRQIAFEVKSFIGSAAVGNSGNLSGIAAPVGVLHGVGTVLPMKPIGAMSSLKYTRENISLATGSAGIQAGEGTAKPWYQPGFQQITQEPLTVAALTKVSEQAIRNQSELVATVEALIKRDIALQIDQMVLLGSTTPAWPGLMALAVEDTSALWGERADAAMECQVTMEMLGSNPTAIMMAGTDWLQTALMENGFGMNKAGHERYLKEIERRIGSMRVGLSANVTTGKALLIDPLFVEIYVSQDATVSMAYVEDDFEKNLISLRVECEIIPVLRSTRGIRVSKPKPA